MTLSVTKNRVDLNGIHQILNYMDANAPRDEWVRVLMAIKSEFGSQGMVVARDWSSTSASYKKQDFLSTWKSIKPMGGITIGSLIHDAKKNGWRPEETTQAEQNRLNNEYRLRRQASKKAEEDEIQRLIKRRAGVSKKACQILEGATPAPATHAYLKRKQIDPHGVLFGSVLSYLDALIIPIYGTQKPFVREVQTLQFIQPDGVKRFLKGGKKSGGYFPIQWIDDAPIVICEGFATGATLAQHYAPYSSVICAFDSGNLLKVAKWFRQAYPMAQITIAGDNDHTNLINTGKDKAEATAKLIRGLVAIPSFEPHEQGTDWNDRYILDQQNAQLAKAEHQALSNEIGGVYE